MGNVCKKTTQDIVDTYEMIDSKQFMRIQQNQKKPNEKNDSVIGIGGFATVYHVRRIGDDQNDYAMKTMKKLVVFDQKNIQPTLNEVVLLRDIQHPFVIDMKWAFCDESNLYLVMKQLKGKDLRFHIINFKLREDYALLQKQKELDEKISSALIDLIPQQLIPEQKEKKSDPSSFTENQTRFIMAQLCLGLNYLHNKRIIHRDIKPENVLFEENGYLRITDFGIAKSFRPNNSGDNSGTLRYMAPEVLCRQNHNYSVDYYAIGVMTYEMMLNKNPYESEDQNERKDMNYKNEIIKNVLNAQIEVEPYNRNKIEKQYEKQVGNERFLMVQAPREWSNNGIDFINKCLKRKPTERMCYFDINEFFQHPWFAEIDFDLLFQKKYKRLPFCELHMRRSEKRQRVQNILLCYLCSYNNFCKLISMKALDEQIKVIEVKIEQDRLQKAEEAKRRARFDGETQQDGFGFFSQLTRQVGGEKLDALQQNAGAAINVNQAELKLVYSPEEQAALDQERLQSIQHFFKHYYFDRDRYELEVSRVEESMRKKEEEKQNKGKVKIVSSYKSKDPSIKGILAPNSFLQNAKTNAQETVKQQQQPPQGKFLPKSSGYFQTKLPDFLHSSPTKSPTDARAPIPALNQNLNLDSLAQNNQQIEFPEINFKPSESSTKIVQPQLPQFNLSKSFARGSVMFPQPNRQNSMMSGADFQTIETEQRGKEKLKPISLESLENVRSINASPVSATNTPSRRQNRHGGLLFQQMRSIADFNSNEHNN